MNLTKILLLFLLLFAFSGFSQNRNNFLLHKDTNNYYVDVGAGIGPNYGILGIKSVIGKNGTGLMVGLGFFDGYPTFSIGGQFRFKWWFANLSYAPYGSYQLSGYFEDKRILYDVVFMTGGQINLSRSKNVFLELAGGYHGKSENEFLLRGKQINAGFTFGVGLGYRFIK